MQQFIIYLEPIDNSQCIWTISIVKPQLWFRLSGIRVPILLLALQSSLNCLYRFLFLSRRRSKKLITVPTGYTTSSCRWQRAEFFLLPRLNLSFFLGPGFLVSTFLLVSRVSWPSKEDIASHMALTQHGNNSVEFIVNHCNHNWPLFQKWGKDPFHFVTRLHVKVSDNWNNDTTTNYANTLGAN